MGSGNAIVDFYVYFIQQGVFTLADVPNVYRPQVEAILNPAPPAEPETPEEEDEAPGPIEDPEDSGE